MKDFKIVHTSDWHLGKKLFKTDRTREHEYFLDWLKAYIKSHEVKLLLIAGDIYDVPTPPNSAQKLFYDFIFELGKIPHLKTIIIPGNHDSTSLFEIPKEFFKKNNCYIFPKIEDKIENNNFYLNTDYGKVGVKSLPYFRNFELINHCKNQNTEDASDFFQTFFSTWEEEVDHKILVSHHGFGQYSSAGSEHAIHLSGLDYFPLEWVKPYFDYVALGHIHKKQELSQEPPIIYCGSPIPMRFSERNEKFIFDITLNQDGLQYHPVQIPLLKKLIQLKTDRKKLFEDFEKLMQTNSEESYLEVIVDTDKPISGAVDQIRKQLNDSSIELLSFIPRFVSSTKKKMNLDAFENTSLEDLFADYYKMKYDTDSIPPEIQKSFTQILAETRNENPQD